MTLRSNDLGPFIHYTSQGTQTVLPVALESRVLFKPFSCYSVLWKLRKKANLIKARFNTKKGPDLAFLPKNFQDQMAYDVYLPKESLWNRRLRGGGSFISM